MRILFLVHHPIEDASSRYRILQYIPYLEKCGHTCVVRPFTTSRLFGAVRKGGRPIVKIVDLAFCTARRAWDLVEAKRFDLIVIHREAFPFFAPLVEKMFLRRSPRVVFSFDDAVYVGHDLKAHRYPFLYRFKYSSGIHEIIANSTGVIAGSSILADYARQYNDRVETIPTVVDTDLYRYRSPADEQPGPLTIGWHGSNSTSPYLSLVFPALERLARRHGDMLRFRFYGDTRLKPPLPNCEILPFRLQTELSDLRSISIGLMPLTDTPWTRAKCAFKAIQYMALGIPTVVSPLGMAAQLVQDGKNGLYAHTDEDWYRALNQLILDAGLRTRLAEAGRQTVVDKYSLHRWAPEFVGALERAIKVPLPLASTRDESRCEF